MKKTLFPLLLLPFSIFAQEGQTAGPNWKTSLQIKFEKLSMQNQNMTLFKKDSGNLEIDRDYMSVSGPVNIDLGEKKMKRPASHDWQIVAHNVYISKTSNAVSLKANLLTYDEETKTGELSGNIIIVDNGEEKSIGTRGEIDFSNDDYKIVSIK